jgi:hypothetical protein
MQAPGTSASSASQFHAQPSAQAAAPQTAAPQHAVPVPLTAAQQQQAEQWAAYYAQLAQRQQMIAYYEAQGYDMSQYRTAALPVPMPAAPPAT